MTHGAREVRLSHSSEEEADEQMWSNPLRSGGAKGGGKECEQQARAGAGTGKSGVTSAGNVYGKPTRAKEEGEVTALFPISPFC